MHVAISFYGSKQTDPDTGRDSRYATANGVMASRTGPS